MNRPLLHAQPFPDPFPQTWKWRLLERLVRLAEGLFFSEILMFLNGLAKPNCRRLTAAEIQMAEQVFGQSIDYQKVRLDARARIACRKHGLAYVGFHSINSWGELSPPILIHELMHVWQFQHLGAVYIPRALFAQTTRAGYDYGGVENLRRALAEGRSLLDFNYEQQADIVADFFCLKMGWRPRWCRADRAYLPVFQALVEGCLNQGLKIAP